MNKKIASYLIIVVIIIFIGFIVFWYLQKSQELKNPKTTPQPTVQKDTTNPTVSLTSPSSKIITSGVLEATVNAADNQEVERVEYKIDGIFAAVSYSSPFSSNLDVSSLADGEHTLSVVVYDKAGNSSSSNSQTFIVKNSTAVDSSSSNSSASSTTKKATQPTTTSSTTATTPSQPIDSTAPSTPTGVILSQSSEHAATVSWNASTDNVGVTGYQVWRSGTLIHSGANTSYVDTTSLPGATYTYRILAYDAANNQSSLSSVTSITLAEITIFNNDNTPPSSGDSDTGSVELGMRFRPTRSGFISGIRFYKNVTNTGTHTGTLWTSGGSNLATVTFTGESASGWQVAKFASPIAVAAGTNYVASYHAPNGHYAATLNAFAQSHFSSQYLIAPKNGDGGSNGIYTYSGSTAFPTSTNNDVNFWVDTLFSPSSVEDIPTARNCPAYPAFPDASCTGTIPSTTLMPYTGTLTVSHDNMTLYNLDITGNVVIDADNVTLINCKIHDNAGGLSVTSGNVTITDSELYNSTGSAIISSNWTAYRLNIHSMADDGVKFGNNVILADSYLHDFTPTDGAHADGGQLQGGLSNVVIQHNTSNITNGNSAFFLAPDQGPNGAGPILIDKNLLGGGNYTLAILNGNSGTYHQAGYTVTNNHFLNNATYGPISIGELTANFTLWSNNTYHDTGIVIPGP